MKEIIIKSMRFVNFKGLRDLTISYPAKHCDISADNGLGKSTIFDGFTWVLFGKDRKDRKQFGIKTYDANNVVIPRLPHEVELLLIVDGQELKLTRRFCEKWVKQRGSATEEFAGHEEERLYNDVPCSLKEWNAKIEELCSEQIFKLITNPLHFTAQKPDVQRQILFDIAGGVSDVEVAAGNADFTKLLAQITGKTMEEFKKELSAKMRRIKKEIDDIPGRIDERGRDIAEPEDWMALEVSINDYDQQLQDLEKQLSDISEMQKALAIKQSKAIADINTIKGNITRREFEVREETLAEYRKQASQRAELMDRYNYLRVNEPELIKRIQHANQEAQRRTDKRAELISEYSALMAENKELLNQRNKTPEFSDSDFRCPTCGHTYDINRIDEIERNAIHQHQVNINRQLTANAERIEDNKRRGKANNEEKEHWLSTATQHTDELNIRRAEMQKIEGETLFKQAPVCPDVTPAIEADKQIQELRAELYHLEAPFSSDPQVDVRDKYDGLNALRRTLIKEREQLVNRLGKREAIERGQARIAELEASLRKASQELAELERTEFLIMEFSKARVAHIEEKINSLFGLVRFKMFDRQINGAEVETCECMIDGVPFSDLNDAGRINAGLDIINAICKHHAINAPIFIDNAESVNYPLATSSQRIRLIVSHDKSITVKPSEITPSI